MVAHVRQPPWAYSHGRSLARSRSVVRAGTGHRDIARRHRQHRRTTMAHPSTGSPGPAVSRVAQPAVARVRPATDKRRYRGAGTGACSSFATTAVTGVQRRTDTPLVKPGLWSPSAAFFSPTK